MNPIARHRRDHPIIWALADLIVGTICVVVLWQLSEQTAAIVVAILIAAGIGVELLAALARSRLANGR
jgi:uncharacterized membrane protein